jgi:hypothetical protein
MLPRRRGSVAPIYPICCGQGGEFGRFHGRLSHPVQIEPRLRPKSPKNGSFPNVRRRLSAISLRECPKPAPGDRLPNRKSPPLAGLSASIRGIFSERRTAWLGREDSNLRMVESKSTALPLGDAPIASGKRVDWPSRGFRLATPVYRGS